MPDRVTPPQDFRDSITITGVTGTFLKYETITGSISGSTATTTIEVSSTNLLVSDTTSLWNIGETITGSRSGATATISSVIRRAAIEWEAYTGWYEFSKKELKLYDAYINWENERQSGFDFVANAFVDGEVIPNYDDGDVYSILPEDIGGAYYNYSLWNNAYYNHGVGQISQNTGAQARGNYFSFGFKNSKYNEWAQIYGIEPIFSQERNDEFGKNY
jgi:hypothetical protein